MHKHDVEALVAEEEAALRAAASAGEILRVERRGTLLVAELARAVYPAARLGYTGTAVPLLGQRREAAVVVTLRCDNYDTEPPSVAFATDWAATAELPFEAWPKGPGMVARHHETGRPFLCRPGTREYHRHFQHGDDPWDKYRGRQRPRDLLLGLARDLCSKQVF